MTITDKIQQRADKIARRFNDDVRSIAVFTPDDPNNENYGSIIVEFEEWSSPKMRNGKIVGDHCYVDAREELQKFVLTLGAKLEFEYDGDGDGVQKYGYKIMFDDSIEDKDCK